jgi:pyruvate dehydrogenase (quinone)
MTTVAAHIVDTLAASGVRRVHGLPGDSLNGFTDAIRRSDSVAWEHVRHEETAAFAASGEAALTGELAVCAGSCGPGNLHLINGLYDAQRSGVPVLAVAAHIPGSEIGSQYFQETHPQQLFAECSVYVELISDAGSAPRILRTAMRAAVERRGVAVVVVPGEVLNAHLHGDHPIVPVLPTRSTTIPDDDTLETMAAVLNRAERPTILAGAGTAGAHDELIALADVLGAPIVYALRGKEHVEYDNPFDVGLTGLLGFSSGYRAMKQADVLVMLGTDFPYRQFYPRDATVVQVDRVGEVIGRRVPVDVPVVGDVADTVVALLPRVNRHESRVHLERSLHHYRRTRKELDHFAIDEQHRTPIRPEYLARVVDETAAVDAVFTVDVGSPVVWAARYLTMNGSRRLLGSFNHGSMACALPLAIGAQTADRGRQVVALAGDGGLAMGLGELLTVVQNRLPVKIIIVDNSALAFVELEMKAAGFVNYGTDLENPDFAAVASAIGLHAIRVTDPEDLRSAVAAAFAHDGPALVDAVTARQELAIPPGVSAEQAKGFGLYAVRTVLSGRGDELLDLIEDNVVRRVIG